MPQWHKQIFFSEFYQNRNSENVMRQSCQSLGINLCNTICVNGFLSVSTLLLIECYFATNTVRNMPCIQNSPLLHWNRIKFIVNFQGPVLKNVFAQDSKDTIKSIRNGLMSIRKECSLTHSFIHVIFILPPFQIPTHIYPFINNLIAIEKKTTKKFLRHTGILSKTYQLVCH